MRDQVRDAILGLLAVAGAATIAFALRLPEPPRVDPTPASALQDDPGAWIADPEAPVAAEAPPVEAPPLEAPPAEALPAEAPPRPPAPPLTEAQQTELLGLLWDEVDLARRQGARCGDRRLGPAPRLRGSILLDDAALAQARWMAQSGARAHETPGNPSGRTPKDRLAQVGFPGGLAGEVLAWGQATPRAAARWWLDSPDHCAVLLDPDATHGGAAVVREPATGDLLWVIVLGRR